MFIPAEATLHAYLNRILETVHHLEQLDLSQEEDRLQAMNESRDALGAIALYRGMLENIEECIQWQGRTAA